MKYIMTAIIVLVVAGAGMLVYAWSGAYNIAATQPHWRATLAFIDLLKDRSIEVRSEDTRVPEVDEAQKGAAFSHFHEMCRLCHGAPGYPSLEFASGFNPSPPSLISGRLQQELSEAEIYWVVKHGIKMTGMPAFGLTHDEQALWGLAALVGDMPGMTPEQYRQQVQILSTKKDETDHGYTHEESESEEDHGHGPGESSGHGEAK